MTRRLMIIGSLAGLWVGCSNEPAPTELPEADAPLYYLKAPTNSGDGQSDTVLATLALPFRVLVRRGDMPAPGIEVIWEVDGDTLTGQPRLSQSSFTDDGGIATSPFRLTLGSRSGEYAMRARIAGVFSPGPLQYFTEVPCGSALCFTATARPGQPRSLHYVSGRGQFGTLGTLLDSNYVVQVTDAYGNGRAGVVIDWAVTSGGGSIAPTQVPTTGARGLAAARHTLGSIGDTQTVRATAPALAGSAAIPFTATGFSALPVASVTVTPESVSVPTDRTKQLSVVLRDANGGLVIRRHVTWTSQDPVITTVDTTGLVRGASPGTSLVTAESEGVSDSAAITVTDGPPPVIFASIVAGSEHTCGLRSDGTAHCWGDNTLGQLGISSALRSTTPVAVSGGLRFTQLVAGSQHTCGLTAAGVAYCWGRGEEGQLGNGFFINRSVPIAVAGGLTFRGLMAGYYHTCGVIMSGQAHCWGWNNSGQLGNGSFGDRSVPVAVLGGLQFSTMGTRSGWHTCGLAASDAAYCWGHNFNGELGNGSFDDSPIPVAVVGGLSFTAIAAGVFHTCGLTGQATVYCWGDNHWGELGDDFNGGARATPGPVPGVADVASIASGGGHTCTVSSSGIALCWGRNYDGQIGDGSSGSEQMTPAPVFGNLTFAILAAGGSHTCGLTVSGVAYCWGLNQSGQLGDGTTGSSPLPVRVVSEP